MLLLSSRLLLMLVVLLLLPQGGRLEPGRRSSCFVYGEGWFSKCYA